LGIFGAAKSDQTDATERAEPSGVTMTESDAVTVSADLDLELAATDTEIGVAFDRIVDATTRLMDIAGDLPEEVGGAVHAALGEILEASATRDIAGQRLSNVRKAVRSLSGDRLTPVGEDGDGLLNGPQRAEAAPDQDAIDAMFANEQGPDGSEDETGSR
jgi:hypothetical protein